MPLAFGRAWRCCSPRPPADPIAAVGLTSAVIAGSLVRHYFMTSSPPDERVLPPQAVDESVAYSNILPEDYVGPEVCAQCHQQQHAHWLEHPHRLMNQLPSPASVMGDFNDALLTLPTGEIRFTTDEDGEYWMTVRKNGETYRRYQVTRTVGSKYMQFYIGKQIEGPDTADHDIYREHMLPFSYWFKIKRWLPRQFFDPDGPEQLKDGIPQCETLKPRVIFGLRSPEPPNQPRHRLPPRHFVHAVGRRELSAREFRFQCIHG